MSWHAALAVERGNSHRTRHPAPGTNRYVLFFFFFSPQDSMALP